MSLVFWKKSLNTVMSQEWRKIAQNIFLNWAHENSATFPQGLNRSTRGKPGTYIITNKKQRPYVLLPVWKYYGTKFGYTALILVASTIGIEANAGGETQPPRKNERITDHFFPHE